MQIKNLPRTRTSIRLALVVGALLLTASPLPAVAGTDDGRRVTLSGRATSSPSIFGEVTGTFTTQLDYMGEPADIKVDASARTDYTPASGASRAFVAMNWDFQGDFTSLTVKRPPKGSGITWSVADFGPGHQTVVVVKECPYDPPASSTGTCQLTVKNMNLRFNGGTPSTVQAVQGAHAFWPVGPDGGQGDSVSVSVVDSSPLIRH